MLKLKNLGISNIGEMFEVVFLVYSKFTLTGFNMMGTLVVKRLLKLQDFYPQKESIKNLIDNMQQIRKRKQKSNHPFGYVRSGMSRYTCFCQNFLDSEGCTVVASKMSLQDMNNLFF